jgi:C1A family cysteine protease
MRTIFNAVLIFAIFICFAQSLPTQVKDDPIVHILNEFMNKSTKELFKVWHFLFNKQYDYNTEAGIEKYKVFRASVKAVKEHNASDASWKKGLNHLSDMTTEEIKAYYNLKPMSVQEMKAGLRKLMNLDDFNDDESEAPSVNVGGRVAVDWTKSGKMQPVKDQGGCGSCWAFTTITVLESNWQIKKGGLTGPLSTQQLVDCDAGNYGCDGGWFTSALNFFKANRAIYDSVYPYKSGDTGVADKCSVDGKATTPVFTFKTSAYWYKSNADAIFVLLQAGPVAVAVDANDGWFSYASGILNYPCSTGVNHAVSLVGYGTDAGVGYWIIRNSWSSGWGNAGHIYVKEDPLNANSCNIGSYGYQPRFS